MPMTFAANPSSSGATIVRGETTFQVAIFDAEKQLLAFHNFRNAFPACGEAVTEIRLGSFKEVHSGTDATLFNTLLQAPETFIWVWHSTDGSVINARCTEPIAKGVGKLMYTDNDVTSFLGERARSNAFGFSATGTLTGSDGSTYHYSGMDRIIWQPDGVGGSNEVTFVHLGRAGP